MRGGETAAEVLSAGASLHPCLPQFLLCKTGATTATLCSLSLGSSTRHRWKALAEGKCHCLGAREVRPRAAERLVCRHAAPGTAHGALGSVGADHA